MANYSFRSKWAINNPGEWPDIPADGVFRECNFGQKLPNTEIFPDVPDTQPLHFEKCNLTNCTLPAHATRTKGVHLHKDYCLHLNEDMDLPDENENCRHVVDIDTITIDGVLVDTIYHYEDTIV